MTTGEFPQLFPAAALEEIARFHEDAAQTWSKAGGKRGQEIADMHLQRAAAVLHAIAIYAAVVANAITEVDEIIGTIEAIKDARDSIGRAS